MVTKRISNTPVLSNNTYTHNGDKSLTPLIIVIIHEWANGITESPSQSNHTFTQCLNGDKG